MGTKICFNGSLLILSQNYYGDAIAELNRFLRVYPKHKDMIMQSILLGFVTMSKL
jgi:hypothetical protein